MMAVEYPHRTRVMVQAAHDAGGSRCRLLPRLRRDLPERPARRAARRDRGGTGGLHEALPDQAEVAGSLPATVKERLDQGRDEPAVVEALDAGGRPGEDAGEPSWGVLAHLAREARFVQVFRRLHFMANMWHVPAGDAFAEFRPLVASTASSPT